jgi:arylsulfatase A-like enzyme
METRMNGRVVKGGKGKLTENGIQAPFIVGCPGLVPQGVVTDALLDFTDLFPTFADLGGAPLPEGIQLDGRSAADYILGRATDTSREWILAMGGGVAKYTEQGVVPAAAYADRVVRDKRFKLWVKEGKGVKLFDLKRDPIEANNLIESRDPVAAAARTKLEEVVRTFPEKDSAPRYDPMPPQPWEKDAE